MTYHLLLFFQKKNKLVRQHIVCKPRFRPKNWCNLSFAQKTKISSYLNSKTPHQCPHNTHKPFYQLQTSKKQSKNLKSNWFCFGFFQLRFGFSYNIEDLNNHHEVPLISQDSWTPRKLILVSRNRVNDEFFSHRWNPTTLSLSHLLNQDLKNNTNKLGYENWFLKKN